MFIYLTVDLMPYIYNGFKIFEFDIAERNQSAAGKSTESWMVSRPLKYTPSNARVNLKMI